MIDKDSIEKLKQIIDIREVISSYLDLRKAGMNYMAPCPFHDEKTPSFIVSPSKGYFKCYGCGVGGDAIAFVMQKENIEFYEAIEKIANIYNFTLSYTNKKNTGIEFKILDLVASYYVNNLNENIISYLTNRGLNLDSIQKFKIGYSGDNSSFIKYLNEKQIPFDVLLKLGILGKSVNGYYQKFNSRIIFPIHLANGKIAGFGGRVLEGNIAKYINSPQSKLFNKSQILYGLNLAKDSIYKEDKIIITEGYIDTIMMHQAGFSNAVATLGVSLTQDHLPILNRMASKILICYDSDRAGLEAAFRASNLLLEKEGGVILLNAKDPADVIAQGEASQLEEMLKKPKPFIEFAIEYIIKKHNIKTPLGKEKAFNAIKDILKNISPVLREEYRLFVSLRLKIPLEATKHIYTKNTKKNNFFQKKIVPSTTVENIIIKSIIESNKLLDIALEYINANTFLYNAYQFQLLIEGKLNHENLVGIALNDNVKGLNYEEFKEQLRLFIIHFYNRKINEIKNNKSLSYDLKIKEIDDVKNKINILKSGKLIKAD